MKRIGYVFVGLVVIAYVLVLFIPPKIAIDIIASYRGEFEGTNQQPNTTTKANSVALTKDASNVKVNANAKNVPNAKVITNVKVASKEKLASKVKVASKDKIASNVKNVPNAKVITHDKVASKVKVASNVKAASKVKFLAKIKVKSNNTLVSKVKVDSNTKAVSKTNDKLKKPKVKYLIYICDVNRNCGGLGDRQRGIAYTFMASIQLGRKFGIVMSTPCDIRQFFIPNKYDWMIPESDLIGKPQKVIDVVGRGAVDLSNDTTEVIYLRTNSPGNDYVYRRIRNKLPLYLEGGTTRAHIFKLIWESLMKPSYHVNNHLKTLNLSKNMTCAHVRIGRSKNLPNDPPRNNVTNISKLWDFMETFDKGNVLFVATDNNEVRESARLRFGKRYFDTDGKIVHIDRQKRIDDVCLGFETAIIDQIILSKCNVLIISLSQFSARAAYLRNNPKDLYYFHGTAINPYKLT